MFNKFGGGKMDFGSMQSQLNSKLQQSKMKERLQAKLKKKQSEPGTQIPEDQEVKVDSSIKKKKKKKNKKNIHDPVLDKRSDDPSE